MKSMILAAGLAAAALGLAASAQAAPIGGQGDEAQGQGMPYSYGQQKSFPYRVQGHAQHAPVTNSQTPPQIHFFRHQNCEPGKLAGKVDAAKAMDVAVRNSSLPNDDIGSVRLVNVPAGTVLELWDAGNVRDWDDWCRITVMRTGSYQLNNLDQNPMTQGIKFERFGKGNSRTRIGNLTSKVSHIFLAPPTTLPAASY